MFVEICSKVNLTVLFKWKGLTHTLYVYVCYVFVQHTTYTMHARLLVCNKFYMKLHDIKVLYNFLY